MANESKKFALFACCLMTMQALRLVISTAGFCAVRFHIDCELFGIFISRLVNAVLMSQLFGNWLGDLIVFAANGPLKLYAIALANWAEFICFCTALICFCAGEQGHLTGFYWSMVLAYFWWKVGEAPATSIGGSVVDWYFAGFTLSGVWAACLKGVVMMFVTEDKGIHSDILGDVNVSVVGDVSIVGARSVKSTIDYRAAKWLFAVTILITALMCVLWDVVSSAVTNDVTDVNTAISNAVRTKDVGPGDNKLATKIRGLTNVRASGNVTLSGAEVKKDDISPKDGDKMTIVVTGVVGENGGVNAGQTELKTALDEVVRSVDAELQGAIQDVAGDVATDAGNQKLTLTVTTGAEDRDLVLNALKTAATQANSTNNALVAAIKAGVNGQQVNTGGSTATLNFENASVDNAKDGVQTAKPGPKQIQINVTKVKATAGNGTIEPGTNTNNVANALKGQLEGLLGAGRIEKVQLSGSVSSSPGPVTLTVTVNSSTDRTWAVRQLQAAADAVAATSSDNKLANAIKKLGEVTVVTSSQTEHLNFAEATIAKEDVFVNKNGQMEIRVRDVKTGTSGAKSACDELKKALKGVIGFGKGAITGVTLEGRVTKSTKTFAIVITVSVEGSGRIANRVEVKNVAVWAGVVVAGIMAVPGAMLGSWLLGGRKWCAAVGAVTAVLLTRGAYGGIVADVREGEEWVDNFKWPTPDQNTTTWAPMMGLMAGLMVGLVVGVIVACWKPRLGGSPLPAGAFFGSFIGLWSGEIYNGDKTWKARPNNFLQKPNKQWVVACGFFINVLGLGTVYSIYPGMAPCSITQFQYFNIIDIIILILSAIAPIVIMVLDLAELPERLAWTILTADGDLGSASGAEGTRMYAAIGSALVMLIATNICEIVVIDVLQHPNSKNAQKVTSSPWRACTLTILMVTFQLTSTGIGFACVAAGSGLNVGIMNVNSTIVLWTTECCGVLGEGYLTELKKYEPGKWPTQGMGKWDTYWWWNGKAFGNAWQIWCHIGTTDLRRDIMLCRK